MITQQPLPFFPGPEGDAFSNPIQSAIDGIRVFDQVFGGVLLVMLVYLMFHSTMLGRKVICLGMLFLTLSVVGTEFEALGTAMTYRLIVNTVGLLVVATGIWITYLRSEP